MKRVKFYYYFLAFWTIITVVGCTEKPLRYELEVDTSTIKCGASCFIAKLSVESNYNWKVKGNMPEWISIDKMSGEEGTNLISLTVSENPSYEGRSCVITICSGDLERNIYLEQSSKTFFTTLSKLIYCSEYGESVSIQIKTNTGCTPEIVSGEGWVKLLSSKAIKTGDYLFGVSPLTMDVERRAEIVFKDTADVAIDTIILCQSTKKYRYKEVLSKLYLSTSGEQWTNKANWNSDKPFREWYGIETYGDDIIKINLSANNLKGTIPDDLSDLTELTSLQLWSNELGGEIPSSLAKLTKLEELIISDNQFSGVFPDSLYNMPSLLTLSLNYLSVSFDLKKAIAGLKSLEQLYLDYIPLNCKIPEEIGDLSKMKRISMMNCGLYGPIPDEIYSLSLLDYLILANNELNGEISPLIANLVNMKTLGLANNILSGKIPVQLCALRELNYLQLFYNMFEGAVPLSLKSLPHWDEIIAENNIYQQKDFRILSHSGYVLGDLFYDKTMNIPIGVVVSLNDSDGKPLSDQSGSSQHYSVINLDIANYKWSTIHESTKADSFSDGYKNCSELNDHVSRYALPMDIYPALTWCNSVNAIYSNRYTWFIPSPGESLSLYQNRDLIDSMFKIAGKSSGFADTNYMTSYDGTESGMFALSIKSLTDQLQFQDKSQTTPTALIMKK